MPDPIRHRDTYLVQIAVVFLAYLVAGKLGQATTAIRSNNIGPVWPAYGISVAAVLVYGYRIWPALLSAGFIIALLSPVSALTALGQAGGTTVAALTAVFLLRHLTEFDSAMRRLSDVVAFVVFGASASAMVSASIGTVFLYSASMHPYTGFGVAWLIYWFGDATGALIVTPLVLTIADVVMIRDKGRFVELLALLLVLPIACIAVFGDTSSFPNNLQLTAFAVLPFVIWASARLGMATAAFSIFLISAVATVETALGFGPLAGGDASTRAIVLDIFFSIISITALMVAAVSSEREEAEHLHRQFLSQRDIIQERLRNEQSVRGKLVAAQEQEKTRIARDLHDDVGQRLAILAIGIEQLAAVKHASEAERQARFGELHRLVEEVSSSVQTISHELHSTKLVYLGLVPAMRSICNELSKLHKLEINFRSNSVPDSVPPDISVGLFRVLQEALHNAVKYSGVAQVDVEFRGSSNSLDLVIKDTGKGFDFAAAMREPGLGLVSMYERMRLVNGELWVESGPEHGTTITAHVPIEAGKSASSNQA